LEEEIAFIKENIPEIKKYQPMPTPKKF